MIDEYIAHGIDKSKITQSVSEHNKNVAVLAETNCSLKNMKDIAWIAGILHDAGKYQDTYQEYIEKAMKDKDSVCRGTVDHATAGGQLMEQIMPHSVISEMVQIAIYCHHGLTDCFSLENGNVFIYRRLNKTDDAKMVSERFFQFFDKAEIIDRSKKARICLKEIMRDISKFVKKDFDYKNAMLYGNREFFLGMYERVLMSLLIDSDRIDTANFMQGDNLKYKKEEFANINTKIWNECIEFFEMYLKKIPIKTKIDRYRQDISLKCKIAAKSPDRLYRLTVPTGAGKTLSSLRYALHHAKEYEKERIIYIAPYNSILEQNASDIRNAIGNAEIVLEHHCNIIHETNEAREQYDALTENWDSKFVATTAVQFLNALFSSKTGSVRRMHNLCNSIIIFDEIQALPIRIMKIFNLAVNFLTTFCNTTVVLCSATQPLLDRFQENRMLPPKEMADEIRQYAKAFSRTTIIDNTKLTNTRFTIEKLSCFVLGKLENEKQVLVIVNTRKCAGNLYNDLSNKISNKSENLESCRFFGEYEKYI